VCPKKRMLNLQAETWRWRSEVVRRAGTTHHKQRAAGTGMTGCSRPEAPGLGAAADCTSTRSAHFKTTTSQRAPGHAVPDVPDVPDVPICRIGGCG
jgi:hypothetical protein